MKRLKKNLLFSLALLALILPFAACQPASLRANRQTSVESAENTNERPLTPFERELKNMETADFEFVYVVRRKDGGVFDREDKDFVRANTPIETNRRILTDDDKAIVMGSHFEFSPENLNSLIERFLVYNHSKPKPAVNANQNTNGK